MSDNTFNGILTRAREKARRVVNSGALQVLSRTNVPESPDSTESLASADSPNASSVSSDASPSLSVQSPTPGGRGVGTTTSSLTSTRLSANIAYTPAPSPNVTYITQSVRPKQKLTSALPSAILPSDTTTFSGAWDSNYDFRSQYRPDLSQGSVDRSKIQPKNLFSTTHVLSDVEAVARTPVVEMAAGSLSGETSVDQQTAALLTTMLQRHLRIGGSQVAMTISPGDGSSQEDSAAGEPMEQTTVPGAIASAQVIEQASQVAGLAAQQTEQAPPPVGGVLLPGQNAPLLPHNEQLETPVVHPDDQEHPETPTVASADAAQEERERLEAQVIEERRAAQETANIAPPQDVRERLEAQRLEAQREIRSQTQRAVQQAVEKLTQQFRSQQDDLQRAAQEAAQQQIARETEILAAERRAQEVRQQEILVQLRTLDEGYRTRESKLKEWEDYVKEQERLAQEKLQAAHAVHQTVQELAAKEQAAREVASRHAAQVQAAIEQAEKDEAAILAAQEQSAREETARQAARDEAVRQAAQVCAQTAYQSATQQQQNTTSTSNMQQPLDQASVNQQLMVLLQQVLLQQQAPQMGQYPQSVTTQQHSAQPNLNTVTTTTVSHPTTHSHAAHSHPSQSSLDFLQRLAPNGIHSSDLTSRVPLQSTRVPGHTGGASFDMSSVLSRSVTDTTSLAQSPLLAAASINNSQGVGTPTSTTSSGRVPVPSVNPGSYVDTTQSNRSIVQDLSTLLSARLPPVDIDKFDGDYKRYETFKKMFKTLIATTETSPRDQAKALYEALKEDVVEQLDFIPKLDAPGAYEKLWKALDTEYGRFQNGAVSYVIELSSKLQSWPVCRTSEEIHSLYKLLRSHYNALEQVNQVSEVEHGSIRVLILGRLTGWIRGRCSTLMDDNPYSPVMPQVLDTLKKAKRKLQLEEMSTVPEKAPTKAIRSVLKNNFVSASEEEELENVLVNYVNNRDSRLSHRNVQFSPRSSRERTPSPRTNGESTNGRYPYREGYNTVEVEQRFNKKCFFCPSDEHDSESCNSLTNPEDYKNILFAYRLCFNCKRQGHRNYHCIMPKTCNKNCSDSTKHCSQVCIKRD